MTNQVIDIDGTVVAEGTSVYDTAHDRVLWIAEITEYELMIEVAHPYETDEPIGWPVDGADGRIDSGTLVDIETFRTFVEEGRFEIGPRPTGLDASA